MPRLDVTTQRRGVSRNHKFTGAAAVIVAAMMFLLYAVAFVCSLLIPVLIVLVLWNFLT